MWHSEENKFESVLGDGLEGAIQVVGKQVTSSGSA